MMRGIRPFNVAHSVTDQGASNTHSISLLDPKLHQASTGKPQFSRGYLPKAINAAPAATQKEREWLLCLFLLLRRRLLLQRVCASHCCVARCTWPVLATSKAQTVCRLSRITGKHRTPQCGKFVQPSEITIPPGLWAIGQNARPGRHKCCS